MLNAWINDGNLGRHKFCFTTYLLNRLVETHHIMKRFLFTCSPTNIFQCNSVGVLKMHSSGVPTHKIQIQANGSPQIIAASPEGLSGSSTQVCLDPGGYSSDVDVCNLNPLLYVACKYFFIIVHYSDCSSLKSIIRTS